MKYRVTLDRDEAGAYVVKCPLLPGCISEGKTREEALANIVDAIEVYLESLKADHMPVPAPADEALAEVGA